MYDQPMRTGVLKIGKLCLQSMDPTLYPMIKKLAHVCLFSDQLDNMIAFYRDVMGFPVKFTMKNDDGFRLRILFRHGRHVVR